MTVEIAENQREIVLGLAARGLAPVFEPSFFKFQLTNSGQLEHSRLDCLALVDGKGADRVLLNLEKGCVG